MQKGFEIDMFGYEPEFVVCGDARIAYYDVAAAGTAPPGAAGTACRLK